MAVYLDYNATTPIDERVLDVMIDVYRNHYGNADSRTHNHGDQARMIVENARAQVASLFGINSTEVFFTSGATESNNIAIQGLEEYAASSGKKHIITSSIEHKAVLETAKAMKKRGFELDLIDPDESGRINAEELLAKIRDETLLVSVQHVNNETGIIQPVKEIGDALSEKGVLFHVDATQSSGKLVEEIRELKYDMLSFSAHKLQGPQGIGCLILRKKNYRIPPVKGIMFGGQQEHGIRPGTIPVALVAGCGKACELAEKEYRDSIIRVREIRNSLITALNESGIDYLFNGDQKYCISSTLNLCFKGVSSEALMLTAKQFCSVSNGSACTSNSYAPSYVLTAMGFPVDRIESSIRFSWGAKTDMEDYFTGFANLLGTVRMLG